MTLQTRWIDNGREPQCPPDPAHPKGVHVNAAGLSHQTCTVTLDYPAPRCGVWLITCDRCGQRAMVTTAGRPDDPRGVTLACQLLPH